jgi:multidrug efflux pump subunit AcrB
MERPLGVAGTIARAFIDSKLTPLGILAAVLLGVFAIVETPREEEPQIIVPMMDVMVAMPGASQKEVEQRIAIPMEMLVREIPGVEYVYSISEPGQCLVIVRYYVGTNQDNAVIETYTKLYAHLDRIPPGATPPLIKVRSIDDVPIMALTMWGKNYNPYQLRQVAEELDHTLKQMDNVSETHIIGGLPRHLRVLLDTQKLAAYGLSPAQVLQGVRADNDRVQAGSFSHDNQEVLVDAGHFYNSIDDLERTVITVHGGRPVYLRDVADRIVDGAASPTNYVMIGSGAGASRVADAGLSADGREYPAVTLTIAKRKGTNATVLTNAIQHRLQELHGNVLPADLQVTVTRNYGATAEEKSNELLEHLGIATFSVALLIALALGLRAAGVVLLAVPVTLSLTLAVFYFYGYTLNRVTLFALIFSIGILVDNAIVVTENMMRHFSLPENAGRSHKEIAIESVAEVGNPTILATFTVIAAILPMAFVHGLMGPYMRPIPVGASSAMLFSLMVAFVVSPWAALRLLGSATHASTKHEEKMEGAVTRFYRRVMTPLIYNRGKRVRFLLMVVVLLVIAVLLVPLKLVHVKLLPFDNKSEFQLVLNMPNGTTLEQTTRVAQALGDYVAKQPEVTNYEIYSGTSGPYNFNGLVRHYYLRQQPNLADVQVNLLPKNMRSAQSHEIAKRMRPDLDRIAASFGGRLQVTEIPPGPPVMQTLVAEIYGPNLQGQIDVARQIKHIFKTTPGVVDADWYVEDPQQQDDLVADPEQANLHGVPAQEVAQNIFIGLHGMDAGLLHSQTAREPVPIEVRLSRNSRSDIAQLQGMKLPTANGSMISLGEVSHTTTTTLQPYIYRKNLRTVVYVIGDVAGQEESPVYAILRMDKALGNVHVPDGYGLARYNATLPVSTEHYSLKWDGEWQITIDVFRDLGVAFAAVLVLIYVLVVGWFRSFIIPLVIMAPIPLTLVGILPAHALLGVFFTATSMIGFIAGAGIIVMNSIILVDFIELRRGQGMPLEEAVIDAGAVRFRPILLTAGSVIVGALVIYPDPVFQGLALSLIAGEVASTLLSLRAIPVLYYIIAPFLDKVGPAPAAQTSTEGNG